MQKECVLSEEEIKKHRPNSVEFVLQMDKK